MAIFREGPKFLRHEKVICIYQEDFFLSKILKIKRSKLGFKYLVHYINWNRLWDEWVTDDRIFKITAENFEKYGIEPPKKLNLPTQEELEKQQAWQLANMKFVNISSSSTSECDSGEIYRPRKKFRPQSKSSRRRTKSSKTSQHTKSKSSPTDSTSKEVRYSKKNLETEFCRIAKNFDNSDSDFEEPKKNSRKGSTDLTSTEDEAFKTAKDACMLDVSKRSSVEFSHLKYYNYILNDELAQEAKRSKLRDAGTSTSESSGTDEDSKNGFTLKLPDQLRYILLNDHSLIRYESRLVITPADVNVKTILDDFKAHAELNNLVQVQEAPFFKYLFRFVEDCFGYLLGKRLLYDAEREQYTAIVGSEGGRPSTTYGAIHLLRMLALLPSILNEDIAPNMTSSEIKLGEKFLKSFFHFLLVKFHEGLFTEEKNYI